MQDWYDLVRAEKLDETIKHSLIIQMLFRCHPYHSFNEFDALLKIDDIELSFYLIQGVAGYIPLSDLSPQAVSYRISIDNANKFESSLYVSFRKKDLDSDWKDYFSGRKSAAGNEIFACEVAAVEIIEDKIYYIWTNQSPYPFDRGGQSLKPHFVERIKRCFGK